MEFKRSRKKLVSGKEGNSKSYVVSLSILEFPDCILFEIFSRLPISTILNCRCVCKLWYRFISQSDFANAYMKNPPFKNALLSFGKSIFYLLELKSSDYSYSSKQNRLKLIPNPSAFSSGLVTLLGSSNGLIFFACFFKAECKYTLFISNPLMGEYALLPQPKVVKKWVYDEIYGFGFSSKTGHYKVLRMIPRGKQTEKFEVQVCTVGVDNSWRSLGCNKGPYFPVNTATRRYYEFNGFMPFFEVNGTLNWRTDDIEGSGFIYSFDIGEEKLQPVPPPFDLGERHSMMRLGVLRDCLCLFDTYVPSYIHIWSMKEYGVAESWIKEIILDTSIQTWGLAPFCPVLIWGKEEILMSAEISPLISYDPGEKRYTTLEIKPEVWGWFSIIPYTPCFLSLNDVIKAGHREETEGEHKRRNEVASVITENGNADAAILGMPAYILVDIFSRLPVNTIALCMSVCKTWYNFISSPRFANAYFTRQPFINLVISNRASIFRYLELKADGDYSIQPSTLVDLQIPDSRVTLLGSCNGLVCLSVFSHSEQKFTFYICNPLLREYAVLPQPKVEKGVLDEAYGFGFSPVTGHYKIVRFISRRGHSRKCQIQVHTIGMDVGWRICSRTMRDVVFEMPKKWSDLVNKARICETTLHGALHWMVDDCEEPDFIYSFDIGTEVVQTIPPPRAMGKRSSWTSLGVLQDCLCVFHTALPPDLDIWQMKEYDVSSSWTKEIIVGGYIPPSLYNQVLFPIAIWRNGDILISVGFGRLISYSRKENKFTELGIQLDPYGFLTAVHHVPSFLSLKAAVRGGHLEVVKLK